MVAASWQYCIECLKDELPPEQFNTWIRPLRAEHVGEGLKVSVPNRFILDWVRSKFLARIEELLHQHHKGPVVVELGVSTDNSKMVSEIDNSSRVKVSSLNVAGTESNTSR